MPYDVSTFTYGRTGADVTIWIQRFIAKMTANGWVRTSDTGQINPTTISPTATYVSQAYLGYAMFVLDDSYRASDPIYTRVNFYMYGVGGTANILTNYVPQADCTICFSTDGAGGILGESLRVGNHANAQNSRALTFRVAVDIFAAGDGWVTVAHGIGLAFESTGTLVRQICFFQIQRERDINGVVLKGRIFVVYPEPYRYADSSNEPYKMVLSLTGARDATTVRLLGHHLYKTGGGTVSQVAAIPGIIGSAAISGSVNGVIQAQPSWQHLPQIRPAHGVIAVPGSVLSSGAVFAASIDGVNEFKYAALGVGSVKDRTPIGTAYAIDSFAGDTYGIAVRVE